MGGISITPSIGNRLLSVKRSRAIRIQWRYEVRNKENHMFFRPFSSRSTPVSPFPVSIEHFSEDVEKANDLCNDWKHVVGSLTKEKFRSAKATLWALQNEKHSAIAVQAAIRLFLRLFDEMNYNKMIDQELCNTRHFNKVLVHWKAALRSNQQAVATPAKVVEIMLQLRSKVPAFQIDSYGVSVVFGGVLHYEQAANAPLEMERIAEETQVPKSPFMLSQLAQAWAYSGQPQTQEKIHEVIEQSKKNGSPDIVVLNTLLGCYGRQRNMEQLEATANLFKSHKIQPNAITWNNMVHGYARVGRLDLAMENLMRLLENFPILHQDTLSGCVQAVLVAIRQAVSNIHPTSRKYYIELTESVRSMSEGRLEGRSRDHMFGSIMEILIRTRRFDAVEAMMEEVRQPTSTEFSIVIKSCGLAGCPDKAEQWFKKMLDLQNVRPDVDALNATINAWAESSFPNKVESAFLLLRVLDEDPRCNHLRPNLITMNNILKTLALSNQSDSGILAEEVLSDMTRRGLKPDHISFSLAYKAYMAAHDYDGANVFFEKLETLKPLPDVRFYNGVLNHWLRLNSIEGARGIEKIIERMHLLASENRSVSPNVYSYSMLIRGWMVCEGDASLAQSKIQTAISRMKSSGIKPDQFILNQLVQYYSRLKSRETAALCVLYFRQFVDPPSEKDYAQMFQTFHNIGDVDRAIEFFWEWVEQKTTTEVGHSRFLVLVVNLLSLDRQRTYLRKAMALVYKLDPLIKERGDDFISEQVYGILRDGWGELETENAEREAALADLTRKIEAAQEKQDNRAKEGNRR